MAPRPLPANVGSVPHLDQFFGDWAMLPESFRCLSNQLLSLDLAAHLATHKSRSAGSPARTPDAYRYASISDGLAVVPIQGTLMKHETSFSEMLGGTSTVLARRDIRKAAADDSVAKILLRIESPGGTAAGTAELFDDIQAAGKAKPVWAFIEDLGASAAYWTAAGAGRIVANRMAKVGSIGTYAVVRDTSSADAARGIETHVIRAGEFKGTGVDGTKFTDEQRAAFQQTVDSLNQIFVTGVATGRKMSIDRVRKIADGRVHIAGEAKQLGLIDAVQSYEECVSELRAVGSKPSTPVVTHASFSDAVAFVRKRDQSSFDAAYETASKEYPELKSADQQRRVAARPSSPPAPPKTTQTPPASATSVWNAEIKNLVRQGKTRAEAIAIVNRACPGLRERFLAESRS